MKKLVTPLTEAAVRDLKAGDAVAISGVIYTGRSYAIEKKNGDEWEILPYLEGITSPDYTADAVEIPLGGSASWTVDWTNLYGTLTAGTYRIVKPVMLLSGSSEETKLVYAEFTLNS